MKAKREKDTDLIEIDDFEKHFLLLQELTVPIQSNFQAIVFDYTNKVFRKKLNNPITNTRTDLLYRISSILYFVELIKREEVSILNHINSNIDSIGVDRMRLSTQLVQNLKSIFDTILYHLSSLFDYYARMLDFLYNGKLTWKWNSLVSSAKDNENTKIGVKHRDLIIQNHQDFVDSLFSHRSSLIHKTMSHPGFKFIHNLGEASYKIQIITPNSFVKEFKDLKEYVDGKSISLEASVFWILTYGFKSINKLLLGLKSELEAQRKYEAGNDVFINSKNPEISISEMFWEEE